MLFLVEARGSRAQDIGAGTILSVAKSAASENEMVGLNGMARGARARRASGFESS